MKLLKPHWVCNKRRPIFSVDIHPDGSRFATGGQGQDCGLVNIWNMAPVRSKEDEANESVPKSLCEMSNHLGCVNSVRWSHDGKSLASGGDDSLVIIWQIKYQGASKSFGGNHPEQWGCVHMLRGHNGDVLGVAWSHDHQYLASCSVDNSFIIWNARDLPQRVALITGHQGLVKGLAWDPVGKYIASQADDRSVRIWRTNDWQEMKQIREPFVQCGGTTHVLRLSWSPDGKFIVTAHALNNDGPTAQIIERGDWKTGIDFVGHRKAVEVVLFNPHLFVKKGASDNHGCVVLGSRDRSLSVWLTNLKRPLVVLHDLFTDSILDLSWSKDGYELVVCSTDGSVAYLKFTTKELGVKVSEQALDDIFMATYGSRRASNSKRQSSTAAVLIEDPAMLKLVDTAQKTDSIMTSSQKKEIVSTSASVPSVTKQIEIRRSDGRRRITPITLTTQPSSLTDAPLPFPSSSKPSHASPEKTSNSPPSKSASIKSLTPNPIRFEPLSPTNKSETNKSETKSKSKTVDESSKTGGVKRTLEPVVLPRAKKLKRSKNTTTTSVEISRPNTPQKSHPLSNIAKRAQVLLPVPEVEPVLTCEIIKAVQEKQPTVVRITNNTSLKVTIECLKEESVLWCNTLTAPVLVAGGNDVLTCVVCKDKSVRLYSSKSGRLLLPSFQVSSLPHAIKVTDRFLLVVFCNATASVWDTNALKVIVKEASFASLLQDGKKTLELKSVVLTTSGVPAVEIQNTKYIYHNDMCVWMEVHSNSEQPEATHPPLDESLPLRALQHTTPLARTDTAGLMLSSIRGNSSQMAILSHLESQVSRSLLLHSPLEYAHWCTAYVHYLVSEEQELRLREFCGQFMTPSGGEGGKVLGLSKRGILKDLLPIIAGNAHLQRLYCELRDSLD